MEPIMSATTVLLPRDVATVEACNRLLRGEYSAAETFEQAIDKFGSDAPPELTTCLQLHRHRAQRLVQRVIDLGGDPSEGSGAWGAFAKLVEGGAALFGRSAILSALEEGESHGLAQYRDVIAELDADSRRLVESDLLPGQQHTYDLVRALSRAQN